MCLKVLAIDETTGRWSRVTVAISVESWLAEVGRHRAIGQEPAFQLQLLHLLANAALLLFCQLMLSCLSLTSVVSQVCVSVRLNTTTRVLDTAVTQVLIQVRAALSLALLSVSSCCSCHCLRSEAHLSQLSLDELPLQLHWVHQRPISTPLVNT